MARDVVTAIGSIPAVGLFALLSLASLKALLGPLPVGGESVLWVFAIASCVAAIGLAAWSRSLDPARGFGRGLLSGYAAMLIAGVITLLVWLRLFYSSGAYEKAGYERLMTGLLVLLLVTVSALAIAARFIARTARTSLSDP